MKRKAKYQFILFQLMIVTGICQGQPDNFIIDTSLLASSAISVESLTYVFHMPVFTSRQSLLDRKPYKDDTLLIQLNRSLINEKPDIDNHEIYSLLANALWRAGQIKTAKKMFLKIEQSASPFYTNTEFHSAGNTYEYGSYTSSFKNDACQNLCKIFIEENNYSKALSYLEKADKLYEVRYNCGTGAMRYANQLNSLYCICYSGLGQKDKVIDMFLKENFYFDETFPALIKKKYKASEIKRYLHLAIDNITFIKDEFPVRVYTQSEVTHEDSLISTYENGTATTILFGKKIILPGPALKDGEKITRQYFIDEFTNSVFYTSLIK